MCSFTFTTHGLPSFIFEIHVPESLKVPQGDRLLFYYDKKTDFGWNFEFKIFTVSEYFGR